MGLKQLCTQQSFRLAKSNHPLTVRRTYEHRTVARSSTPRIEAAEGSAEQQSSSPQTGRTGSKPNPEGLRLQKVERLGDDVWAGVAAVDRGSVTSETSLSKAAALVVGDLTAILVFAAIGRAGHGESLDPTAVLKTAAPFLIGWFGAADLQKAYGKEAQGGVLEAAAKKAAVVWATGVPVGIGVRTAQRGYLPDLSFVIVTLAVTLVFLVGWRSALAALTPDRAANGSDASRRRDKQGNPLEFLQLLASLTKRW